MLRRLSIFVRWLKFPSETVEVVYVHTDVKEHCKSELKFLLTSIARPKQNFYPLFLQIRLVYFLSLALRDKPKAFFRFRTLRAVATSECRGIHAVPDAQERLLEFYFIETYGYRIALLLNTLSLQASIYHIERLQKYQIASEAIQAVKNKHALVVRTDKARLASLRPTGHKQK